MPDQPTDERAAILAYQQEHSTCDIQKHPWTGVFSAGWAARGEYERAKSSSVIIARLKDRHQERAAGVLWNGPHGACSTCMLPYPCPVARALKEAEEDS